MGAQYNLYVFKKLNMTTKETIAKVILRALGIVVAIGIPFLVFLQQN